MEIATRLSHDRRELWLKSDDGRYTAYYRSALTEGFSDDQIELAKTYAEHINVTAGEKHNAWRKEIAGHVLHIGVNTGPPTWWLPRIRLRWNEVMIGWLRGLVAVKLVQREM